MADVVRQQADAGLDIPSDGEQRKIGFLLYGNERMAGSEQVMVQPGASPRVIRRDQAAFSDFYDEYFKTEGDGGTRWQPVCTGPITYTGQEAIKSDISHFKAALQSVDVEEAFLFAIAGALKEEYKAIIDAGFVLQIDDPGLPDTWDMLNPAPSVQEYQKYAAVRMEALNHALEGLPQDRIRYHICWGSWHGPHSTDIPLKDVVDLVLRVNA